MIAEGTINEVFVEWQYSGLTVDFDVSMGRSKRRDHIEYTRCKEDHSPYDLANL